MSETQEVCPDCGHEHFGECPACEYGGEFGHGYTCLVCLRTGKECPNQFGGHR